VLVRLPTSISEAQACLADGAVPVGGATLVWATWQRDGFPEQAVSLSGDAGSEPPLVVAVAVQATEGDRPRVRVAVRDGYEVLCESTAYNTEAGPVRDALSTTAIGTLPLTAREAIRDEVTAVLTRADDS
jgi:hypothetical protein